MKPKLKYAPLAIATAIVNVIALIGTYMIYSPLNSLENASSSGDYASLANFSTDSLTNASLIFLLGIVATAVIAILLLVFFIYEERKIAIIISCVIGAIEFVLFLRFFDTILSTVMGGLGSLIWGSTQSESNMVASILGSLQLTLVVTFIGAIFHIIVLLQMYHVIHLSFLQPYTPSLLCGEVINVNQESSSQESNPDEGGESQ